MRLQNERHSQSRKFSLQFEQLEDRSLLSADGFLFGSSLLSNAVPLDEDPVSALSAPQTNDVVGLTTSLLNQAMGGSNDLTPPLQESPIPVEAFLDVGAHLDLHVPGLIDLETGLTLGSEIDLQVETNAEPLGINLEVESAVDPLGLNLDLNVETDVEPLGIDLGLGLDTQTSSLLSGSLLPELNLDLSTNLDLPLPLDLPAVNLPLSLPELPLLEGLTGSSGLGDILPLNDILEQLPVDLGIEIPPIVSVEVEVETPVVSTELEVDPGAGLGTILPGLLPTPEAPPAQQPNVELPTQTVLSTTGSALVPPGGEQNLSIPGPVSSSILGPEALAALAFIPTADTGEAPGTGDGAPTLSTVEPELANLFFISTNTAELPEEGARTVDAELEAQDGVGVPNLILPQAQSRSVGLLEMPELLGVLGVVAPIGLHRLVRVLEDLLRDRRKREQELRDWFQRYGALPVILMSMSLGLAGYQVTRKRRRRKKRLDFCPLALVGQG